MGYGVMAVPFAGGDLLAFRRFVSSTIGPGYTAVWHRDAGGTWTFYLDVEPSRGCPRYFGADVRNVVVTAIDVTWTGPDEVTLSAPAVRLEWGLRLGSTGASRALGVVARALPTILWRRDPVLRALGALGARVLNAGRLTLAGSTPNGYRFVLRPEWIWTIEASLATLRGRELGRLGPLLHPARLGGFLLPQAPLFVAGSATFESEWTDPLAREAG